MFDVNVQRNLFPIQYLGILPLHVQTDMIVITSSATLSETLVCICSSRDLQTSPNLHGPGKDRAIYPNTELSTERTDYF
jgi:hypothetical protein